MRAMMEKRSRRLDSRREERGERREERKGKLTAWLLLARSAAFVGAGPKRAAPLRRKKNSETLLAGRPRPSRAGHG